MSDSPLAPLTPQSDPSIVPSHLVFPVVGIGASAGGLQALIRLFENMPKNNGMAFVVVLHLLPDHASAADHVLQRATSMRVTQVVRPTLIEAENIYVIAANQQLSMIDGFLSVTPLDRPHGSHIAIDVFFRTLAGVHRERAVAVVLSGTGADGTVGLTRIMEQGGITIVQAPDDSEYDGMPLAAIRTGIIDFVLPLLEIPQKLIELWENASIIELTPTGDGEASIAHLTNERETPIVENALLSIISSLLGHTGHDFRHYKRATVLRRIERRMQVRAVHTLPEYSALLDTDPREHDALLSDMLISVTNFFRDREAFEAVERDIIPKLFKDTTGTDEVRVWVTACATGEEAYSMAMLLADHAGTMATPPACQVFASDIDKHAIGKARTGRYPASILTDVPPMRLRQYFANEGDHYRIRKSIRDRILFAEHNVLRDPPFSRLDMVSCQNLLIYLTKEVQAKVLEIFHFALKPGGYLFLGGSESAELVAEYFIPIDKKHRIYRTRPTSRATTYHGHLPAASMRSAEPATHNAPQHKFSFAEVHQHALMEMSPPSVVLDRDANIVHISESVARFLRMLGGEPSRNVLALVLPELRLELRSALFQAQQGAGIVVYRPVMLAVDSGELAIAMQVMPFRDKDSETDFTLVQFSTATAAGTVQPASLIAGGGDVILNQLEAELQRPAYVLKHTATCRFLLLLPSSPDKPSRS